MGGSGMQRGSGSSTRVFVALSLGALVVVSFLYISKRVEANRTARELEMTRVESRDISDGLNNRIAEFIDKLDSVTQEASIAAGQLENCHATVATLEQDKVRMETQNTACEANFHKAQVNLDAATAELGQIKADRDSALKDSNRMVSELTDLQEENAELSSLNDQCEAENERLHSKTDQNAVCSTKLSDTQKQLKAAVVQSSSLLSQVSALTQEKQLLQKEVSKLKGQVAQRPPMSFKSPLALRPTFNKPEDIHGEGNEEQGGEDDERDRDNDDDVEAVRGDDEDEDMFGNGQQVLK